MAGPPTVSKPTGTPASSSHAPSSCVKATGDHAGQTNSVSSHHPDPPAENHHASEKPAVHHEAGSQEHEPTHEAQSHSEPHTNHQTPESNAKGPTESAPDGKGAAQGAREILRARPFILKALRHDEADGSGKVTGGVLSQTLDKMGGSKGHINAETLSMAALRKLMPDMSRYAKIDKFCTPSGTLIDDESISIVTYLELEGGDDSGSSSGGTPSIKIYFRSTNLGSMAGKGAGGTEGSSVEPFNLADRPNVEARQMETPELLAKPEAKESLINMDDYQVSVDEPLKGGAGTLTETEWALVLRNCAVFYGWIFDPRTRQIVRAPKPAFQLRSKVDQEAVAKIPDFVPDAVEEGKADAGVEGAVDGDTVKTAPSLAAKLKVDLNKDDDTNDKIDEEDTKEGDEQKDAKDKDDGDQKIKKKKGANKKKEEEKPAEITPRSDHGIPNFRVNDDSRVEITAHEDEMSVSMARSDFSESSTEASISGGGFGFSASASYAHASGSESGAQKEATARNQTIVARYMFPRCDLILWPNELEPTEELAQLLETIRRNKNIKDLRRLHAEYGNLFCQRVTLGGRLLSTKVVSVTTEASVATAKESFKTSVGASISGGYGGFSGSASASHSSGGGSASANAASSSSQNEACVFEAVGGETILATNPQAWSPTVADHEKWRVINREALSPLAEIISGIPGYEAVQSWFVRAIPAMSRYMTLDEAHVCKARLRVTAPSNGLMIENNGNNASFYLGHDPAGSVTPREIGANGVDTPLFWLRIHTEMNIPIFNPATWRAPAIFGYGDFKVGDGEYGSKLNADFAKTEWDIIAPFDEELKDGTRVILRSCPFVDPDATTAKTKTDAGTATKVQSNPSHMVVFRNAQGEFLPAMSDSDEYQYWRLLKSDKSTRHIKPGDDLRLCWDFRDQTTGWRDFVDDVFGRRQVEPPPETSGPLFLKVPWPRFEVLGVPTALIMSDDPVDLTSRAVSVGNMATKSAHRYCLQDLHLRIDSVTNSGRGDANDCMLKDVKQGRREIFYSIQVAGSPLQMRKSSFLFGLG